MKYLVFFPFCAADTLIFKEVERMVLIPRQKQFLLSLLRNSSFKSLESYAKELGVSSRTLASDLQAIDVYLHGYELSLCRVRGKGVKVEASSYETIRELAGMLADDETFMTSKSRRDKILIHMLRNSDAWVSIQTLSDEFYVGRTSIVNDLKSIERILEGFDLALERGREGTRVIGDESDIRRLLVSMIGESSLPTGRSLPAAGESGGETFEAASSLMEIFDADDVRFLVSLLNDLELSSGVTINEPYYTNLLTHLLICLDRVSKGISIQSAGPKLDVDVSSLEAYIFAVSIREKIERHLGIRLDRFETDYIYEYLVSFGIGVSKAPVGKEGRERAPWMIADALVRCVTHYAGRKVEPEDRLLTEMVFHIRSLINRLRYGVEIKNEYLREVKQVHPGLFGCMQAFAWAISTERHLNRMSDDEVGYLAMYALAILERRHGRPRLILVCQSGYGTSRFLKLRLLERFPQIDAVKTVSARQLPEMDMSDFDFIISTVRLPATETLPLPVVCVSAMLSERDLDQIQATGLIDRIEGGGTASADCSDALPRFTEADQVSAREFSLLYEEAANRTIIEINGLTASFVAHDAAGESMAKLSGGTLLKPLLLSATSPLQASDAFAHYVSVAHLDEGPNRVHPRGLEPFPKVTVAARVAAAEKDEAIRKLVHALAKDGGVSDEDDLVHAVHERENLGMTSLGSGVALPHGICASVRGIRIVFATTATPLRWTASEDDIRFVVLFAMSEHAYEQECTAYIEALGRIGDLLGNPSFRDRALDARSDVSLRELVETCLQERREGNDG